MVSKTTPRVKKIIIKNYYSDGEYVRQLQATFAEYPGYSKPPRVLKFEKETGAGSDAQSVGILSTFARYVVFVTH